MRNVHYSFIVDSLMYAQVYTQPDITFEVDVLSRFISNLNPIHYEEVKKGLGTFMLLKIIS